ncbi:MAG: site-2 protease family protein [Christensenellales bacterium]|jgi:Zn-dependent protease
MNLGLQFQPEQLISLLCRIPVIFFALSFHEFCHALVAVKLGDPTPRLQGRLTLAPLAHVDWIGAACMLFFGFGWAKPVMTNPSNYRNRRWGQALVSLAGPLSNLLLCFVSVPLWIAVGYLPLTGYAATVVGDIMGDMVIFNAMLFVLNFLPIPPLDGYQVARDVLFPRQAMRLWKIEPYGFLIILALSFTGVLGTILNTVGGGIMNLFITFWGFLL